MPGGLALDGVSLAPLLTRGESLGPRRFYWLGVAMRDNPWKLIAMSRIKPRLYNLDEEISERLDLAHQHPERLEAMKAQLGVWHEDVKSGATAQPGPGPRVEGTLERGSTDSAD